MHTDIAKLKLGQLPADDDLISDDYRVCCHQGCVSVRSPDRTSRRTVVTVGTHTVHHASHLTHFRSLAQHHHCHQMRLLAG